MKGQLNEKL